MASCSYDSIPASFDLATAEPQPAIIPSEVPKANEPNLIVDFPRFNELSHEIRTLLIEHQHDGLQSEYGMLLYRFGSEYKRYMLLIDALQSLIQGDQTQTAPVLNHFFTHKFQVFVRPHGTSHSYAWYVADEQSNTHREVSEKEAKQMLKEYLSTLVPLVEDNFLVEGSTQKTRTRIAKFKGFLPELQNEPEAEPLKQKLRFYEKAVELATIFEGTGWSAIVCSFMDNCKASAMSHRFPLIAYDTNWLPCPAGDVNVTTGETRERWLHFNMIGPVAVNYTVPIELTLKPLIEWTTQNRLEQFGLMDKIFDEISTHQEETRREILVSLYLQLLGDNRHHYLIFWVGPDDEGKHFLVNLLRQAMGPLVGTLEKNRLFRTKEKTKGASSSGSLQAVRIIVIDELCGEDELLSSTPLLKLQTPGDHSKSNPLPFNCATLMCCKGDALPKFHHKEDIAHARVVRFPTSPPGLAAFLTQGPIREQFLNFVIHQGGQYYRQNMVDYNEPLPCTARCELTTNQAEGSPPSTPESVRPESLKEWLFRRVKTDPVAQLRLTELATAYCQENRLQYKQPALTLFDRLKKELPDFAKSFCPMVNSSDLIAYGYGLA